MKHRIYDVKGFKNYVFGADCFLENFPEIKTTGVPLEKIGEFFYIVTEDGYIVDNTTFFTEKEMVYLEPVYENIKLKKH